MLTQNNRAKPNNVSGFMVFHFVRFMMYTNVLLRYYAKEIWW